MSMFPKALFLNTFYKAESTKILKISVHWRIDEEWS